MLWAERISSMARRISAIAAVTSVPNNVRPTMSRVRWVKGRLHQTALAQPGGAFIQQEAISEELPIRTQPTPLVKGAMLRDQDLFNVGWMIEKINEDVPHPVGYDVTIRPCAHREKGQVIALDIEQIPNEELAFRPWRVLWRHHCIACLGRRS